MSGSERHEIAVLKKKKYSYEDIATTLGRALSTVSDEIARNRTHGVYDPRKAQHKAYVRRKYAKYQGMKIVHHDDLRKEITARLMDDQFPKAIAGHITKHQKHLPAISKNAIYRFIASPYGRKIETHQFLRRQKRGRRRGRTRSLTNRTFIDKRPASINTKRHIGDTEADFIVSGKNGRGILLVVVDRRSRAPFLERILPTTVPNMHRAFLRIKARFSEMKTMTTDNDILFARHGELARLLQVKIYFCHPYHSWEKGAIEHVNGVIRRDIPKGSDLSRYSKRFIERLERKLNRRPMQCLDDKTPEMVLAAYRARLKNKKRLL